MAIEVELKDGWTDYDGRDWNNVLDDGWQFTSLDSDGYVVMTRNGYINRFRNKDL